MQTRPLAVLRYLARQPGQFISSEELLKHLWPGIYVTKTVLRVCVHEIRQALEEDPTIPQFARRWAVKAIGSLPHSPLPLLQFPVIRGWQLAVRTQQKRSPHNWATENWATTDSLRRAIGRN